MSADFLAMQRFEIEKYCMIKAQHSDHYSRREAVMEWIRKYAADYRKKWDIKSACGEDE